MNFFDSGKVGRMRRRSMEVSVWVYVDPTETFTVVTVSGERYMGVGVAKRNPADQYDPQVGYDIASARALRELADITEDRATERFTYHPIDFKVWSVER